MVRTHTIRLRTRGHSDVVDLTQEIARVVEGSGIATVFVPGSTAGVTTIEHEPGVVGDLQALFERLAPENARYRHSETAGDDNGSAHVRAGLLGPSLTVPFADGRLLLGTWQQIVFVDFDTRPRSREVIVQVISEEM
jgi:secondary thiamine-phosphate synthase enzyme